MGNRLRAKYKEESIKKGIMNGLNRALDALYAHGPEGMEGFLRQQLAIERQDLDRVTREIVGLRERLAGLKGIGL